MWSLRNEKLGTIYYVTSCQDTHVVSRSHGEIIITGDPSISRTHAHLKLSKENKLELLDCGSKYGTHVNEGIITINQIKPNTPVVLKPDDLIMFGRQGSKWKVSYDNIKTVVSTLSENTKAELNKILKQVNGSVDNEFTESCTHLTMPVLSITMKVLMALSAGIPIVTPDYWKEFLKCVKTKQKLIDYKNYLPPLNESFLRTSDLNLDINVKRKTIFSGKRFIFMLSKHMARYELVIKMAGGTCTHLGQKLSKSELTKGGSIVIQYIPTGLTQTQHSQSLSDCEKVYAILQKNGKRPIPDVEIGLAIIYCTLEKYCNPEYKVISTENVTVTKQNLQTSTLLAIDTPLEPQPKGSKEFSVSCEIPDSEIIKKKSKPDNIVIDDLSSEEMDCNLKALDSEATQKFIIPDATATKRKNDDITEAPKNKRINLEDEIESTSSQYEPLESFLNKTPSLSMAPPKSKVVPPAKRNFSSRSDANSDNENDDEDLFCFKNPSKKSKHTEDPIANKDNPFLDGEFQFKQKTKRTRASASQSSLAASCSFVTQNTQEQLTNDSVDGQRRHKILSHDSQGEIIDLSDFIKPVKLSTGKWLSSEFNKSLNLNQSNANDISNDIKPNDNDLWIAAMKDCVKVENTAIVLNNNNNVYYNENLKEKDLNKKNFKAFKKVINYKKPNGIVNCKPMLVE